MLKYYKYIDDNYLYIYKIITQHTLFNLVVLSFLLYNKKPNIAPTMYGPALVCDLM